MRSAHCYGINERKVYMSRISAEVIAHTKSPYTGKEIFSLVLHYPRFIHSELMTHRILSRSASSSRAMPVMHVTEQADMHPAMPVYWGENQAGMQAKKELSVDAQEQAKLVWLAAKDTAVNFSRELFKLNVHKQIANRITECFQTIKVIVTATEWDNFFILRDHEDAQPEFMTLARAMRKAMQDSIPKEGIYHLPFLTEQELSQVTLDNFYQWASISSARCARVSYANHDGSNTTAEKDLKLFDLLVGEEPLHASPTEHPALLVSTGCCEYNLIEYANTNPSFVEVSLPYTSRNFVGWTQFREWVECSGKRTITPLSGVTMNKQPIPHLFHRVWNTYFKEV